MRCPWAKTEEEIEYHDQEWCKPIYEDNKIFEMLCLEIAQAGLSWKTVLKKRKAFREAFAYFDPVLVASFDEEKKKQLLLNPAIIRNLKKIDAFIHNAHCFLKIQKQYGSFSQYIWSFTNYQIINNHWQTMKEVPAYTPLSQKISEELRKKGFVFMGPVICYSFLQGIGMVNDHLESCPWK